MYRIPSRRRKSKTKEPTKLNLIPVLDSVFIFLFFLLISASFLKLYEISSDIPIISNQKPPKNKKKPLALTMEVKKNSIKLYHRIPSRLLQTFKNLDDGSYDYFGLHEYLLELKGKYIDENMIIINMGTDVDYETLVKLMDAVRMIRPTDASLFKKDKETNLHIAVDNLFDKIVFGNLME